MDQAADKTVGIMPGLPTIFVVGDSTAAQGAPGAIGWGRPLPTFFDMSRVNVINRARGGRSSRTFITGGLWDSVLAEMKAGDTVLIQFGHNDAGPVNDNHRARGSLSDTSDGGGENPVWRGLRGGHRASREKSECRGKRDARNRRRLWRCRRRRGQRDTKRTVETNAGALGFQNAEWENNSIFVKFIVEIS
ncbi:MAG: hypothetical protein LBS59_07185 [Puniceicoccales bacterium]|nr:hypothetical protein [Puniceicoccales bacterium]